MKEKMNAFWKKACETFQKLKTKVTSSKQTLGITIGAVVLVLALIITVIAWPSGEKEIEWGEGITEGIPSFSDNYSSFSSDESYMTAYYTDVTSEQINEYLSKLENDCGIKFNSDKYPRSAIYNDKIIAIHYNVTEKKFSVTVSLQGDNIKQENPHDDQELN